MSDNLINLIKPRVIPPLDNNFMPVVLWNRAFLDEVHSSGEGIPLAIGLERGDGSISVFRTQVFPPEHKLASTNHFYIEGLIKTLLWIYGGNKIIIDSSSKEIYKYLKKVYSSTGKRSFDTNLMSNIYGKPFMVEVSNIKNISPAKEKSIPLGGHLEGCRIGFDLGASDRKVSAVIDGKAVFSEEVV